jgi:hypothetical protein
MKKLVVVLLLGLLIAGSVFAQWGGNGYNPAAQTPQIITGTLQMIYGMLAIVTAGNQVYYVPNLQPYYGVNGLYINTSVSVYGNVGNYYCEPSSFLVNGTWYNFPVYNYYVPPAQSMYVPMYAPMYTPSYLPRYYYGRFGPYWPW